MINTKGGPQANGGFAFNGTTSGALKNVDEIKFPNMHNVTGGMGGN